MKKLIISLVALAICASMASCAESGKNESEVIPSSEAITESESLSEEASLPSEEESSEEESTEESSETVMKKEPVYNVPESPVNVYDAFGEYTITLSSGQNVSFRMFVPDGYDPEAEYPMVLLLHGAGERGNDNKLQLLHVAQDMYNDLGSPVYGAIYIAPQCPAAPAQWVDTPWTPGKYSLDSTPESKPMKSVLEILGWVEENYSVDTSRRYVMGLSMGGFGAWDLILRHNEMFAGAVIMCGGGGDPTKAELVLDTPLYLVHSDDDAAVSFVGTNETVNRLTELGGTKFVFEHLKGYGHGVWQYTARNRSVTEWLFGQVRAEEE